MWLTSDLAHFMAMECPNAILAWDIIICLGFQRALWKARNPQLKSHYTRVITSLHVIQDLAFGEDHHSVNKWGCESAQRYPYFNPRNQCKAIPCICKGVQFYPFQPQDSVKHPFSLCNLYKKVVTRSRLYQDNWALSTGLIIWIGHKEIWKLRFRALALRRSESIRRSANARNVSFRISLRRPIHIINPVDKAQLSRYTSHRCSTTVSLKINSSRVY